MDYIFVVAIWVLFVQDMSTTVNKYEGTEKQCEKVVEYFKNNFNSEQKIAGCFRIGIKPPWVVGEDRNYYGRSY